MATAKAIKTSLFGFLSIALMSAPTFAQNSASVIQTSEQSMTQEGNGNFAMQGNVQTEIVNQNGKPNCFMVPWVPVPCPPPTNVLTRQ